MIKKHNGVVILAALLIAAIIPIVAISRKNIKKQEYVTARIFEGRLGWGYDILVKGRIFIHQETIPALETNKGFETREQAEQASRIILQKLQQGKPPILTKLDAQHICLANH